jgi:hypothetical protein
MIKSDFGLLKSKCCLILCIHQQETCNLSRLLLLRHVSFFFFRFATMLSRLSRGVAACGSPANAIKPRDYRSASRQRNVCRTERLRLFSMLLVQHVASVTPAS